MESAALLSPSSDERLWINLRDRVDDVLDDRKMIRSTWDAESKRGKRFTEDSMLLIKGLDSVSSSLSQLTDVLGATQQLAISMVSKAASLAKELKMIRAELNFMQDRCTLLEEENRRLRDGPGKGAMLDEDDLMRLQLEALWAEKWRLANENANLLRENQCLHQLVEYHQLTLENLTLHTRKRSMGCSYISRPHKEKQIVNQIDDHEILNASELSDILNTKTNLTSLDIQNNGQENNAATT